MGATWTLHDTVTTALIGMVGMMGTALLNNWLSARREAKAAKLARLDEEKKAAEVYEEKAHDEGLAREQWAAGQAQSAAQTAIDIFKDLTTRQIADLAAARAMIETQTKMIETQTQRLEQQSRLLARYEERYGNFLMRPDIALLALPEPKTD